LRGGGRNLSWKRGEPEQIQRVNGLRGKGKQAGERIVSRKDILEKLVPFKPGGKKPQRKTQGEGKQLKYKGRGGKIQKRKSPGVPGRL